MVIENEEWQENINTNLLYNQTKNETNLNYKL